MTARDLAARISIEWTFSGTHKRHGDWEQDVTVLCEVIPAEPEVGAPVQVQIVEVREVPGGLLRPDLLDLAELQIDLIAEAALEAAADREEDAREAAAEARMDAARDEAHWARGQ